MHQLPFLGLDPPHGAASQALVGAGLLGPRVDALGQHQRLLVAFAGLADLASGQRQLALDTSTDQAGGS